MMMARRSKGLSERHQRILAFLEAKQTETGIPASIREIGEKTGISSTSVVNYYLDQLAEMGKIERTPGVARGVRLLSQKVSEMFQVPIMGKIAAGLPLPVPSSDFSYFGDHDSVEIARSILPGRESANLFALKVEGDSMIDAMVNDGDIVVMKPAEKAENGDMVAVWLPQRDETTLKYFYKEKDRYRLQPANPTMQPIYVDKSERLEIRGKVVMVIRQLEKTRL